MLADALPEMESTVSQIGRLLVSTEKNGAPEVAPTETSLKPGVPEPLAYVSEAVGLFSVKVDGETILSVTGTTLSVMAVLLACTR